MPKKKPTKPKAPPKKPTPKLSEQRELQNAIDKIKSGDYTEPEWGGKE